MGARLEIAESDCTLVFALESDTIALGRRPGNDVVLSDPDVSSLHAVITRYGEDWTIRDVGSRNGTLRNGERLAGEHRLREGDALTLGATRVVFRSEAPRLTTTTTSLPPPSLTTREVDVLVALCRPVLEGAPFTPPSTVRAMADELYVTPSAVKQQLAQLYRKFKIAPSRERRIELANAVIRCGAVSLADLRART